MQPALQAVWAPLLRLAQERRQPLLVALAQAALARGMSPASVAFDLGLHPDQVQQLYAGVVEPARLSQQTYSALARCLRLPRIAVRCAAQDIRLEDFYTRSELAHHAWTVPQRLKVPTLIETTDLTVTFAGVLAGWSYPSRERMRALVADTPGSGPC